MIAINLQWNKTKACLVVDVQLIRTAATEILLPVASREFEILANLRVAIGSGAILMTGSGADSGQRDRVSVSSFARQILCRDSPGNSVSVRLSRLSELALWAAVALCSFLVAQLFVDKG